MTLDVLEERTAPAASIFAEGVGSSFEDVGQAIAVDAAGNAYVAGFFAGTADFDPNPVLVNNLTSQGDKDAFVAKYTAAGALVWAVRVGGPGSDTANGIALDPAGNVYIVGDFSGAVDFDPGPGATLGNGGAFLLKLNADGNFVFARTFRARSAAAVAVDAIGSSYLTGSFLGTVDFNPGAGTANLTANGGGNFDAYLLKLDGGGNFAYALVTGRTVNNAFPEAEGTAIALDAAGNVYTSGRFRGQVDFNPDPNIVNDFTAEGFEGAYVSKVGANGVYQFARPLLGGAGSETSPGGIGTDAAGNVFAAGTFRGTVDFDPGDAVASLTSRVVRGTTSNAPDNSNLFVVKFGADGRFVSVRQRSSAREIFAYALALDAAGNVFVTGEYFGTTNFNPQRGAFGFFLTPGGNGDHSDIFVMKLTNGLDFQDAFSLGGRTADDRGRAIAVRNGQIYLTGGFLGTADFAPGPAVTNRDSTDGSRDAFLTALTDGGPPPAARLVVGAGAGGGPVVQTGHADGSDAASLAAFDAGFVGGVRTAGGDVNGDNVPDVIAGTGPGRATLVRVFDGATGAQLTEFAPFEAAFTGGVFVAAGDFNGDGLADLVVTPDEGGGPRVRVLSGRDGAVLADFLGIDDPNFRGGARAAVGDVNGDLVPDLLVAAGFGGGPRLAGFDGTTLPAGPTPGKLFGDFFVFEPTLRNGVFLAAGDLDGDGADDLVVGGGPGGGPRVLALSGRGLVAGAQVQLANFFAGDPANRGGLRVAVRDLDGDDRADIVTGAGTGAAPVVTTFAGHSILADGTPPVLKQFSAFDAGFLGGIFVA